MRQCDCGNYVAASVKVCPYCRRKISNADEIYAFFTMSFILLICAGFLLPAMFCVWLFGGNEPFFTSLYSPMAWAGSAAFWGWWLMFFCSDDRYGAGYNIGQVLFYPLIVVIPLEIIWFAISWF